MDVSLVWDKVSPDHDESGKLFFSPMTKFYLCLLLSKRAAFHCNTGTTCSGADMHGHQEGEEINKYLSFAIYNLFICNLKRCAITPQQLGY